ncbi:hypothetical protein IscW_ISCW007648 [Ixodes scapularis]|uniref:Uncharacterized protein n=1 Tax=Ixodes scapularis TaxID=6945 RepID=B7PUJ9_IXOSC|nr:hypothetical protein IscW_ISCW007648 [Ixodes scapularis]|eukprot:XP_002406194.1 hypothetical protein IscW_ISCW007648 [Ixodes scapularis]
MTAASLRDGNAVALAVVPMVSNPAFVAAIFVRAPRQPAAAAPIVLDHLRPADRGVTQPFDLLAGPDGDLESGLMNIGGDGTQPLCPEEERLL